MHRDETPSSVPQNILVRMNLASIFMQTMKFFWHFNFLPYMRSGPSLPLNPVLQHVAAPSEIERAEVKQSLGQPLEF